MKQCSKEGCENSIFSNLYCKWHQYMRTDKKWLKTVLKQHRKGNTKIKPKSEKRIKEEKEYKLMNPENTLCFFSNTPLSETKEKHHLGGRSGTNYLNKNLLVWVNFKYHWEYHNNSWKWIMEQYWYNGFMERLKDKSIDLYNKHKSRQDKS